MNKLRRARVKSVKRKTEPHTHAEEEAEEPREEPERKIGNENSSRVRASSSLPTYLPIRRASCCCFFLLSFVVQPGGGIGGGGGGLGRENSRAPLKFIHALEIKTPAASERAAAAAAAFLVVLKARSEEQAGSEVRWGDWKNVSVGLYVYLEEEEEEVAKNGLSFFLYVPPSCISIKETRRAKAAAAYSYSYR